ncbi:hypothetical protein [Candidatus Methylomirabilis sp.]|nr:hypothetical protein [Candidatus Methylomirabilis sp.]
MIIPKNREISGIFDDFLSSLLESNVSDEPRRFTAIGTDGSIAC